MKKDLTELLFRLGDDALIAAQRLGEWVSVAPEMEEDIALANIALDQVGAARLLLSYAGELMTEAGESPATAGDGEVTEDTLAYLRDDREFRNCLLVELPNGDFAVTIAKLFFLSAYQRLRYDQLVAASDERLAGIAAKARKESAYHLDHGMQWVIRLGDGTAESHRRMQAAVDEIWPYTHELFQTDDLTRRLDEAGLDAAPAALRDAWLAIVEPVLAQATLDRPADGWAPAGGRAGLHTEHLSYLLAEMQVLHRAHPGARW
ncbi:1,2-phenylacetyl-CoA epoxidase subunit PaaC [Micromonospora sp. NPDC003197]